MVRTLAGFAALGVAFVFLVVGASRESKIIIHGVLQPTPEAHIIFGGDMMFDRSVRTYINKFGGDYIFSCLDTTLRDADLVVANLEGPITDNASLSEGSVPETANNYVFTFDPSIAALLYFHNIKLVNIGNNHILNWGMSGVEQTKHFLENANVGYFGDDIIYKTKINNINFAFINYNEFGSKNTNLLLQIESLRSEGYLPIVYTHWGDEYVAAPERVKTLAHEFVDSGAEIVIGSHPHVVQESELYNGKLIYYSLGNFVFDQYFLQGVMNGLLLDVTFNAHGVDTVLEMPVELRTDRRTCLLQ
ncbi:CapA family protein [Candidatus Parcubacteria bacterium]|nr:CapA family protein [Candidatus Parcubacteria bacterium]